MYTTSSAGLVKTGNRTKLCTARHYVLDQKYGSQLHKNTCKTVLFDSLATRGQQAMFQSGCGRHVSKLYRHHADICSNISIQLESCFWSLDKPYIIEYSLHFELYSGLTSSPERIVWFCRCWIMQYVHPGTNCAAWCGTCGVLTNYLNCATVKWSVLSHLTIAPTKVVKGDI